MSNNNQHGQMMSSMCNNMMPGSINSPMPGQMSGPNQVGMMHGSMPPMKCQSQPSSIDMMTDSPNPNQILQNNVLPPSGGNFSDNQFPLSPHPSFAGNFIRISNYVQSAYKFL